LSATSSTRTDGVRIDVHIPQSEDLALAQPAQRREHDEAFLAAKRGEFLDLRPTEEARFTLIEAWRR
jgi:hypothetical protein